MKPLERDVMIFALGAVAGVSATALFFCTRKSELGVNTEIDISDEQPKPDHSRTIIWEERLLPNGPSQNREAEYVSYDKIVKSLGYSEDGESKNASDTDSKQGIRLIDEGEYFGYESFSLYDTASYTFYADGILANSVTDDVISEPDALKSLGTYGLTDFLTQQFSKGDDAFYVRNDVTFTQYEILYDPRPYKEVTGR